MGKQIQTTKPSPRPRPEPQPPTNPVTGKPMNR